MTRINCIPVEELTDKHLGAEYFELPRVFKGALKWVNNGRKTNIPNSYRLGTGHVTFFYDKLTYIINRFEELKKECQRRGRQVNSNLNIPESLPKELFNDWTPNERDKELNRERIQLRLKGK